MRNALIEVYVQEISDVVNVRIVDEYEKRRLIITSPFEAEFARELSVLTVSLVFFLHSSRVFISILDTYSNIILFIALYHIDFDITTAISNDSIRKKRISLTYKFIIYEPTQGA